MELKQSLELEDKALGVDGMLGLLKNIHELNDQVDVSFNVLKNEVVFDGDWDWIEGPLTSYEAVQVYVEAYNDTIDEEELLVVKDVFEELLVLGLPN